MGLEHTVLRAGGPCERAQPFLLFFIFWRGHGKDNKPCSSPWTVYRTPFPLAATNNRREKQGAEPYVPGADAGCDEL
jgi:hypothetical protein